MGKRKRENSETPTISKILKPLENEDWTAEEEELTEILKQLKDLKDDTNSHDKINLKILSNLLVSYKCTCSNQDLLIFEILELLEKYGTDLGQLHPLVFGLNAEKNYESLRKMGGNLHVRITPDEVLRGYFDEATLWNTVKYHVRPVSDENSAKIYDVKFVLRLFNSLIYPASALSCKLFVEQNGLALLFSSTSSADPEIRTLAYCCLQKYSNLLQELKVEIFNEKSIILYLIRLFKHSTDVAIRRVSSLISHFFARVSKLILHPEDPVYPQIMAFLCMKPIFDAENVPEFYKLLFSSSPQNHKQEREWILTLISEAVLEPMDYQILQNRAGIKLLMTTFSSLWADRKSRGLILRTFQNCVRMPSVAHDLFFREGLHTWITTILNSKRYTKWEKNFLSQIFLVLIENERKYQRSQKGKDVQCFSAFSTAKICSRKIIRVLKDIEKNEQFEGEQEKAKESIEKIEKILEKKWKMKKKHRKV
ncbi:unnamed protein product [Caenorhabditis angaria]|uniref:URB1 C-terminal domain-containing protein n=1 Tax=Caenorhabditis angaria TaxID=860376 RepID=A0A9P1IXS8_9PELO|nr:unnamed protein product [Caenorhabditis angaria]